MPAKKKKATQLRGAVNNIILESLYSGEKYGYEIIKEVEEKTNGKVKLKQPSLYSSLKRFETKNYIKSYWADSDIGGKRHYYSLTNEGMDYYRKHILKADEVEEEIDEIENADQEEYEIDAPEETTNNFSKYSFNVQDKLDQLLAEDIEEDEDDVAPVVADNDESESEELLNELYENNETVFSEEDLINDQNEISEKEEIVADHEFRTPTPITEEIKRIEEQKQDLDQTTEFKNVDLTHNVYDDVTNIEEVVSDNALDDLLYSEEDEEKIEETTQKEKPRIYTDENGITKMYYPDEEKKIVNNKVFDNVGYRTNTETIFDKAKRSTENKNTSIQLDELSDEEREQRTSLFMEKFNNRTRELTANKEPVAQEVEPKQEEAKIDIDYKKVLNGIYDANEQSNDDVLTEEVEYTPAEEDVEEVAPAYVPSENADYNVKIFTEEKNKKSQSKYLLVNKAKFSFGLTMLLFMLVQITVMLVLFKNKGVLMDKQYWVFQTAYVLIALVTLYFCIPVFISPNKQATNTFKLGYMLMFGILAFFIVVILTYAINTFLGMELTNIKYYIPTLVVPVVLSLNFVFGPIIYKIISQSKRLY